MTTTSQTEIERKYDVDETTQIPDLSGIGSMAEPQVVELEAVYFDTPLGDLAQHQITLRRRTGGKDAGWHLKLPAGGERTEIHFPITDGDETGTSSTVPAELIEPVRSIVRDRELTPVARIATRRTLHTLSVLGEPSVEIADDDVSASDIRSGTARTWREWEAELLGVTEQNQNDRMSALTAVEERLVAAGAVPSSSKSKLARTLGRDSLGDAPAQDTTAQDTTAQASPKKGSGKKGSAKKDTAKKTSAKKTNTVTRDDAATVAVGMLRPLVEALMSADAKVRANEPDSIHSMRTIVRRLRSVLASAGDVFDSVAIEDVRARLRRLGAVLGEARDLEVRAALAERELRALPKELRDEAARSRLVEGDHAAEQQARSRVLGALSDAPYYRLLDALDAFLTEPPLGPDAHESANRMLRQAVRKASERTLERAEAIVEAADPAAALPSLHEVRKAARRLRYLAEAIVDAPEGTSAVNIRLARRAEKLQDLLGDHRDGLLFAEHLLFESNRAHAAGENTFVYGMLNAKFQREAAETLERLATALRKFSRFAKKA